LTGDDAKAFKRQVTYGKPKQGAKESVERGVNLVREFRNNNRSVTFKVAAKTI
jgi:hypothetical protein